MSGFAIAALVALYAIYALLLTAGVSGLFKTKPPRQVALRELRTVFVIYFIELLCILVLWIDHDPLNPLRLILAIFLVGEVIYSTILGSWYYKTQRPLKPRPIWSLTKVIGLLILITLLAFVS